MFLLLKPELIALKKHNWIIAEKIKDEIEKTGKGNVTNITLSNLEKSNPNFLTPKEYYGNGIKGYAYKDGDNLIIEKEDGQSIRYKLSKDENLIDSITKIRNGEIEPERSKSGEELISGKPTWIENGKRVGKGLGENKGLIKGSI